VSGSTSKRYSLKPWPPDEPEEPRCRSTLLLAPGTADTAAESEKRACELDLSSPGTESEPEADRTAAGSWLAAESELRLRPALPGLPFVAAATVLRQQEAKCEATRRR
jgi:hypothetical protein